MRMRRFAVWMCLIMASLFLLSSCNKNFDATVKNWPDPEPAEPLGAIINPDSEVRGVWIATVYNIDYPSASNLSAYDLAAELNAILDTCEAAGLNTIFFQVRPCFDALYDSDIFPISRAISTTGYANFDPLDYLLKEAHKRNIYVHAWINPLRVTVSGTSIESLQNGSPLKDHFDWTVAYGGKLYLNAGIPEARDLVVSGVREVVEKYDVDGVVFDDYFYPYPEYDESGLPIAYEDTEAYEAYNPDGLDRADWRRENINELVKACYDTVHETDPECVFGISPFGIWQNNDGKNGGSDTSSFEAYNSLYCDALAWIKGGYVDYISPQIYWDFDSASSPYDELARWWNAQLDGSDVKLYISHASYKYEEGEWDSPEGNLSEQISFGRALKAYRGSIFYGYDEIKNNVKGAKDELVSSFDREIIYTDIVSTGAEVTFSSPQSGSVMNTQKTYVLGTADPAYPLTVDGRPVSMTKSGYFSLYLTLQPGKNSFTFTQNGKSYTYELTYQAAGATNTGTNPVILTNLGVASLEPATPVATDAERMWVSCLAPNNATVTVTLNGTSTNLSQLEQKNYTYQNGGYIGVSYGGWVALPDIGEGEILDLGDMTLTVRHADGTVTVDGPNIRKLGRGAMIPIQVNEDYTHLKITEKSSYYNDYTPQSAGMIAYSTGLWGGYHHLEMGGYIHEDEVTELDYKPEKITPITDAELSSTSRATLLTLTTECAPPYTASLDNGVFTVTFFSVAGKSAPDVKMESNPLIESCETVREVDRVKYLFKLHDPLNFYGFDLKYGPGKVTLSMKNPLSIDLESNEPLSGITIVLDAGHGGSDSGALGPGELKEKDLNLSVTLAAAEKLRKLGAQVLLTRDGDSTLDLYGRMDYLEEQEPDLSISIHQNSMDYSVDIRSIRGTLALWWSDGGTLLSDTVGRAVADSMGRSYQGCRQQMLALCRNYKFPSALIEVGFMTSVEEYELVSSPVGIDRAAEGIAEGVLDYFAAQENYLKMYN